LTDEIGHVQIGSREHITIAERVAGAARRIESLIDLDLHRDEHLVQAPVARPRSIRIDRSIDLKSAFHPA
jgi:hypothetical protein